MPHALVIEASDGLEAVRIAPELSPDLVLLDLGLPSLNGIEVAHRLCKTVPDTKVLFVTQEEDADVVREALNNGAKGYVLKAEAGAELLPAIEAALRGEAFVSSRVRDKV
jgi:DNA-binding NarL/FixJ family response regulator